MTVIVAASVGGSIAFIGSFLLYWLGGRRAAKSAEKDLRQRAYADLLVSSLGVALRVRTMITAIKTRSGLSEGVAGLINSRKQLDALDLHDWVRQDFGPLLDAWSRAWAYGTPEGVQLANKLLDSCSEALDAIAEADAASGWQKVRELVAGADVARLLVEWGTAMDKIAVARRDLANHVRSESGRDAAELFAVDAGQTTADSST